MPILPVLVAVGLAGGIAVGASWTSLWPGLATTGAAAWASAFWAWSRHRPAAVVGCGLAGVVLVGGVLGALAMQRALAPSLVGALVEARSLPPAGNALQAPPEPLRLEGRLLVDAAIEPRRVLMILSATRVWTGPCGCATPVQGNVLVSVGGASAVAAAADWRAGRILSVVATVRRPTTFRNAGAADEARQLARRRIALLATVKSALLVDVVQPGSWLDEGAAAVRARARAALTRAAGPGTEATAVATAVLIGDRAGLPTPLEERLQRAGTFHVIAISGGNIALWAVIAIGVATRLTRHRSVALASAAAALLGYAVVVGGGPSVLRATGMALIALAGQALDQRGAVINVLAATAATLLVLDPLLTFDAGFWLTTAATAGLVVGLPSQSSDDARWRRWARTLVLSSVWAELALLPIVAALFQQVTLAGVGLSAVAIPAMGVVQLAALAAVVADLVAPGCLPLAGAILHAATAAVTESAALVDWWPWLTWRVPPPSPIAIVFYYAAVASWLWSRRGADDTRAGARLRAFSAGFTVVMAAWVAASPTTLVPFATGDLRMTAFDVGQGDAVLLALPNGRRLLVDAGGATADGRDLGGRVVGPALRAMGIRRLDYLVVSHADADHIGGAATLVREFRPAEVWIGIGVAGHAASRALRAAADEARAAWREVRRGERVQLGGVDITVRHPSPPDWERQRPRNDDSVVLDVRYGGVRLWLTGDIGEAVEHDLVAGDAAGAGPAPLTVLKVAHHGSAGASSMAWLDTIHPAIAVASVGATNPFGHPAPDVLARLRAAGAAIWRTDLDGAVTVRTDGRVAEVTTATGATRWLSPQPR